MGKNGVVHKRWNSRINAMVTRGETGIGEVVKEWLERGKNPERVVGRITLEELEWCRSMALCPAADSGWHAHADCKAEGDLIDWLVPGVNMERDDVGNWRAIGKDGLVLKTWETGEGRAV